MSFTHFMSRIVRSPDTEGAGGAVDDFEGIDGDAGLRDHLMDMLDKAEAEPVEAPEPEQKPVVQRERDETGKFKPKSEAAPQAEKPDEVAPEQKSDSTPKPAAEAVNPDLAPLVSLSAAARAELAKASPALQAEIAKREAESHRKITEQGKAISRFESIDRVLAPRRQGLVRSWGSEAAAVEKLFELSDFATRQPRQFIEQFAKQNNIDLSQNPAPVQPGADPQYAPILDEVTSLKSSLNELKAQRAQEDFQRALSETERFFGEKDQAGRSLRPHAETLKNDINRLIPTIRAENPSAAYSTILQTAYDQAVWMNEGVRNQVLEERDREREAKAVAEKQRVIQDARRHSGLNVVRRGSPAGGKDTGPNTDAELRQVLRQQIG